MRRILIRVITGAVLVFVGYGIGYFLYIPLLVDYAGQINTLTIEVSNLTNNNYSLQQTIANKEALINSQVFEITNLTDETVGQKALITTQHEQIASLETEKDELQVNLMDTEAQVENLEDELISNKNELLDTKRELSDVLNISVTQHYQWEYRGEWSWDLPILIKQYVDFTERPRPISISEYVEMAKESDMYVDRMAKNLMKVASEGGYNDQQILDCVISFVQSMPYTVDDETTPYDEYPRYPLETLFDRGGDCEDTSILVAALLDRMGYDIVLLHLENERHMAVGVSVPNAYGMYYDYGGKKYYYLETTGEGYKVGDFPSDFSDSTAFIYSLEG